MATKKKPFATELPDIVLPEARAAFWILNPIATPEQQQAFVHAQLAAFCEAQEMLRKLVGKE